jgi:lycopene beta-cyclase
MTAAPTVPCRGSSAVWPSSPGVDLLQRAGRAWARQSGGVEVDLAVVGAGGAGLSLLVHLDRLWRAERAASAPSVVLVDPVHRRGDDRTWCFWDDGTCDVEPAVHRAWSRVELVDAQGRSRVLDLHPLRYVMIRSGDFYALADDAAARLGAVRIPAVADEVRDGMVRAGGIAVRARWILDSRPAPPRRAPRTSLLQHFRGWTVRFPRDVFDPDLPVLMDFSVPQPAHGVAFGYVLPSSPRQALVEYTQFSRARLTDGAYDQALHAYLHQRLGARPHDYVIEHLEDGAIPMTDAVHARRAGLATFRIGTAGGATRGSTGYTFAAMQRQAAGMAAALLAGQAPEPPPAYPSRHRWMDAVMLRALDRGLVDGPDLFVRLFERNPPQRVLRFLDGATSPVEDLALMRTAPTLAMVRAAAGDLGARLGRRRGATRRGGTEPAPGDAPAHRVA